LINHLADTNHNYNQNTKPVQETNIHKQKLMPGSEHLCTWSPGKRLWPTNIMMKTDVFHNESKSKLSMFPALLVHVSS